MNSVVNKEQIAYLAGFIDADGTISIGCDRGKYKPFKYYDISELREVFGENKRLKRRVK